MRVRLKSKRQNLGITQQQISEKIGVARTTYTNIENGIKNPSFVVALKIKEVLKTNDDNIFLNINVPNGNEKEE